MLAKELIFSFLKKKLLGYIFNVNFAKTFNMLDWDFLIDILVVRRFMTHYYEHTHLLQSLMPCTRTSHRRHMWQLITLSRSSQPSFTFLGLPP